MAIKSKKKVQKKRVQTAIAPLAYYPFLDGFRGIAILFVLLRHATGGFGLANIFSQYSPITTWIYVQTLKILHIDLSGFYIFVEFFFSKVKGVFGVEIFFVLSGFLITRNVLRMDLDQFPFKTFYVRRFLRIYPPYLFLIVISFLLFLPHRLNDIGEALRNDGQYLFFMQNYVNGNNPFLDHTWTLVIFEQFYIFCPLVVVMVHRFSVTAQERTNKLIYVCLGLMVLAPLVRAIYISTGHPLLSWPLLAPAPNQTTIYRCDALAFGCLMALTEPYWGKLSKIKGAGQICWVVGIALFIYLFLEDRWGNYAGPWYMFTLGYAAFGFLLFAAFQGVSFLATRKSLQWLGKVSYGTYLWHYILLAFWGPMVNVIPISMIITGYLASCMIAGYLSSKYIERYFLSVREKITDSHPRLNRQ